jgi:hypothetical protein
LDPDITAGFIGRFISVVVVASEQWQILLTLSRADKVWTTTFVSTCTVDSLVAGEDETRL